MALSSSTYLPFFSKFIPIERLSDTILKGNHSRNIPTKFGLIWYNSITGDLNVKAYSVQRTTDGPSTPSYEKSSHGFGQVS
jgi:hypothetical protein